MGIVVIGVLAVLSVPIMLIVALVKLSWIEDQLSSLCKKIEIADVSRNLKSVPKPAAPVKDNAEETEMKKTVYIEGMMCQHCVAHVKKALDAVDGVKNADVDLEGKKAVVTLEKDVDDKTLAVAVDGAGYKAVKIEK